MARIRSIKPEFWRSPATAKASPRARLLYIAMWGWADDYGVGEWTYRELLGYAFPHDDEIGNAELQSLLTEVATCFCTVFYVIDGRRFYYIPAWDKHQKNERRAQGKHPLPDAPDASVDADFHSSAEMRGTSVRTHGDTASGTGEQGNIGTGEQGNRGSAAAPSLFSDFWILWPRTEGKIAASKAWAKAVTKIDDSTLLELVREYVNHPNRPDLEFIPHASSWLNGERWNDGPPVARSSTVKPSQSDRFHETLQMGRELQAELDRAADMRAIA